LILETSIPAKINLWLEVVQRREDGYHELSSLMLPIGLYDHLDIELSSQKGIRLTCNHPKVPQDSRNLAWKAAELFLGANGLEIGVDIRLRKNIPVGAGLGGGSADAAAVLLGLNKAFENPLPSDILAGIALKLGADVPFFLEQRPALATGIGEKLLAVQGVPDYPLLLLKPAVSVSTRWVYQSLKLTRGGSRIKLSTFLSHPWQLQGLIENDLETVTLGEYPLLSQLKRWLTDQGALGTLMSGSGPTIFGVFTDEDQARKVEVLARQVWKECWTAAVNVLGSLTEQQ
jgi:4-diphosphocytidyl-2-C-methyl-D-erythritol kinase